MTSNGKPVDRPDRNSVRVRQGTGPRIMVSVLLVSLLLAAIAGAAVLYYFLTRSSGQASSLLTVLWAWAPGPSRMSRSIRR